MVVQEFGELLAEGFVALAAMADHHRVREQLLLDVGRQLAQNMDVAAPMIGAKRAALVWSGMAILPGGNAGRAAGSAACRVGKGGARPP